MATQHRMPQRRTDAPFSGDRIVDWTVTPTARLSPDDLFGELDGYTFDAGRDHWLIEVYSITDAGARRWLQIGLHGTRDVSLTLASNATDTVDRIAATVAAWLLGDHDSGAKLVSVT